MIGVISEVILEEEDEEMFAGDVVLVLCKLLGLTAAD